MLKVKVKKSSLLSGRDILLHSFLVHRCAKRKYTVSQKTNRTTYDGKLATNLR